MRSGKLLEENYEAQKGLKSPLKAASLKQTPIKSALKTPTKSLAPFLGGSHQKQIDFLRKSPVKKGSVTPSKPGQSSISQYYPKSSSSQKVEEPKLASEMAKFNQKQPSRSSLPRSQRSSKRHSNLDLHEESKESSQTIEIDPDISDEKLSCLVKDNGVTADDLKRLQSESELNDSIMDFYIDYLTEFYKSTPFVEENVSVFKTLWVKSLLDKNEGDSKYHKVREKAKAKISKDILVLPVHVENHPTDHWMLC